MRLLLFMLIAGALAMPLAARATGTVRVQQSDGSVQIYPNVAIWVVGRTLQVTTANKKGTLIIPDAACSYINKLLRCLPYHVVLKQNGMHLLDFDRGTVYYNPTNVKQRLTYSSMQVEPNGVLAVLKSKKGTYVSIIGKLDGRRSQ